MPKHTIAAVRAAAGHDYAVEYAPGAGRRRVMLRSRDGSYLKRWNRTSFTFAEAVEALQEFDGWAICGWAAVMSPE
jgi:hypothetical protein